MLPLEDVVIDRPDDEGLALYLPLGSEQLVGSPFRSLDKYGHVCTATGALWTPQGRRFDGVDDRVIITNPSTLDFTTQTFSVAAWIYPTAQTGTNQIVCRSVFQTYGWYLCLDDTKRLYFGTETAGSEKASYTNDNMITLNQWQFVAVRRVSTASARLSINCVEVTQTSGTHVDPITQAGHDLDIGNDIEAFNHCLGGTIGELFIHTPCISAAALTNICSATKWRYA